MTDENGWVMENLNQSRGWLNELGGALK